MKIPPLTVHQIWLGPELPADKKECVERALSVCSKVGYKYKFWEMSDILKAFPKDRMYYFWNKLWSNIPVAPVLAAVVDFYKWKILSGTPDDERAIYLDVDVLINRKDEDDRVTLPTSDAYVSFGISERAEMPSGAYIQVYGSKVANVAVQLAEERLRTLDIDSPDFFFDFYNSCKNGKRDSEYSLGTDWFIKTLIPQLEELELSAEIAPQDVFCQFGQAPETLMMHRQWHLATGGKTTKEEQDKFERETGHQVQSCAQTYDENKQHVVMLMSTAKEYQDLSRTLGIISAADIRKIQRKTTLLPILRNVVTKVDYYYVVGKSDVSLPEADTNSPEFYFAETQEDADGKHYLASRFYDALQWMNAHGVYDFLFFCEDDNYVHVPRLLALCNAKKPGSLELIGGTDEDGNVDYHGGLLMPVALVREIVLYDPEPPKEGEDFGKWLLKCLDAVGGKFIADDKFSPSKGLYPTPTNGRITTHHVNIFDLALLHGINTED